MRGHADAETLAAFREELLSRRKAARVSAHLAACSRCAGLDAQLTEVSALLTASTAPPIPDALTARIAAAIAAEAAARAATATDGAGATAEDTVAVGAAGGGTGPRDRAARAPRPPGGPGRARLALRVAAVTAAVVVVAGGGYGVARLLTANPESATSAGAGNEAAPAAGGHGAASEKTPGGLGAPSAGRSAPTARIVSSGTNYQPGQLKTQVSAVLTQHRAGASAAAGFSQANQPTASAPPVPACVPRVTGGKRPLLVDLAKYRGRPATVIVIPGATSGTLRALVVAGRCPAATGRVLATTTFPGSG